MKLLWCVLLIAFGLQEGSLTQSGNLPPSDFPDLPTDTAGALPSNQRSERLLRVFREASHSRKLPIRFTKLPEGAINTSVHTPRRAESNERIGIHDNKLRR